MQHSGISGWRRIPTIWVVLTCAMGLVAPALYGDPQGKAMDAGWCSLHGNWSGSYSCPRCSSGSSGGSSDSYNGPNLWRGIRKLKEKIREERLAAAHAANEEGLAYYREGEWAKAASSFLKAAKKNPDDPVIQKNLASAQARVADEQTRLANEKVRLAEAQARSRAEEQDKTAAAAMQQTIIRFAQSMKAAPAAKDGLGFGEPAAGQLASDGLDFNSSAATPGATQPLEFGDPDAPTRRGAFGDNESNVRFATAEARTPGGNTNAGDQLVSAAASGDLKVNYDIGGAPNAGSLVAAHSVSAGPAAPLDLSGFSERAKKDPEIVASLGQLSELQAKRMELEAQRTALTKERSEAKEADAMRKLSEELARKEKDHQANLAAIADKTEQIDKRRRIIDNTVEVSAK